MGSPTSDDDATRQAPGPGSWGQGGTQYPGPGQQGPAPSYPPPGQGSYPSEDQPTTRLPQPPQDAQRGQTAQFPAVGGYPQGGPGGPYGPGPYPQDGPGGLYPPPGAYGPGGPPPAGGRGRRGLVIALVAGLVVLTGVAVALVIAFARDDGETVSADPTDSPSAAPSSSTTAPRPTEETSSTPPGPTETAGDRTDELLAVLPPDFADCRGSEPAGDGDVAAAECGPSTTQPGPQSAFFYLYDETVTLDQVFVEDVEAQGIDPMPAGETCSTAQGVTTWDDGGVEGGNIACTVTEDGVLIAWTDREFGIEGVVTAPGGTQEELAALAEWWRINSGYRG